MTQDELKKIVEYKDGELYWKISPNWSIKVGDKVGYLTKDGYKRTMINKKNEKLHRLIFLYHYGYFPQLIDHIDGNGINNKIENLREVSHMQNSQNKKMAINNTSGSKNVYWHNAAKKWTVVLTLNKKKKVIGYFEDLELADLVAQEARNKYFGAYARHL